jgi:hypothetical protein
MALYLHSKVRFTLDLNIIGVPMTKDNKREHTYFHNQQLWANHPIFSLSLQIVEVTIRFLFNMIFTKWKL